MHLEQTNKQKKKPPTPKQQWIKYTDFIEHKISTGKKYIYLSQDTRTRVEKKLKLSKNIRYGRLHAWNMKHLLEFFFILNQKTLSIQSAPTPLFTLKLVWNDSAHLRFCLPWRIIDLLCTEQSSWSYSFWSRCPLPKIEEEHDFSCS